MNQIEFSIQIEGLSADDFHNDARLSVALFETLSELIGLPVGAFEIVGATDVTEKQGAVELDILASSPSFEKLSTASEALNSLPTGVLADEMNTQIAQQGLDEVQVTGAGVSSVGEALPSFGTLFCGTLMDQDVVEVSVVVGTSDVVDEHVHLAVGATGILYNEVSEEGASSRSPAGVAWGMGTTASLEAASQYKSLQSLCDAAGTCADLVGTTVSMWLTVSNTFHDVSFDTFADGEVAYSRQVVIDCTFGITPTVTPTPVPTPTATPKPTGFTEGEMTGFAVGMLALGGLLGACICCIGIRKNDKFETAVQGSGASGGKDRDFQ